MSEQVTKHALSRRSFLKTTAAVGAAAAVGGATLQAMAADDKAVEEKTVISCCQWQGCFNCQAKVDVRDGKVVRTRVWEDDQRGRRPCLRGVAQLHNLYSPERIKYPLKRATWSPENPQPLLRGKDEWERITWDEAIKYVSDEYTRIMTTYGNQAVHFAGGGGGGCYVYGTCGVDLIDKVGNVLRWSFTAPSDDMATAYGVNKVYGPSTNCWAFPPFDIEDTVYSHAYFGWSTNPSVAQLNAFKDVIFAKEAGVKIIAVNCSYNVLSQKADIWVHPRPGSDPALVMSMMQVIIEEKLHNVDFLTKYTVAPVLINPDTLRYARMSDISSEYPKTIMTYPYGPDYPIPSTEDPILVWDPEAGAPGVMGEVANPPIDGSFPINGKSYKTAFQCLVDQVASFTPEEATKLCDVEPDLIRELARIAADVPVNHYTGYGSNSYNNGVQAGFALATLCAITGNSGIRGANIAATSFMLTFNYAYYAPGYVWGDSIARPALFEIIKTGKNNGVDYPIKGMYLSGGAVVSGKMDLNATLEKMIYPMEFIAGTDIVMTDTVRYCDIVLPAAHCYEKREVLAGLAADPWILYSEQAVEPSFEAKPDGEIATLLANALGIGEYFTNTFEENIAEALPDYVQAMYGFTLDELYETKQVRYSPKGFVAKVNHDYDTTTGRMEFYVDDPQPRLNYGQSYDYDAEHLVRWFEPYEAWPTSEAAKKYPLILMSERANCRFHSQGWANEWMLEIDGEPTVKANPADAVARGISDGDYVEIYNDRGHAVGKIIFDNGIRPGSLAYPKGWQQLQFKAGHWSELTSTDADPVGVHNAYFDTAVEMRKWEE